MRRQDQGVVDGVSFRASEPAQDVVGGIHAVVLADPDPEPGELVGSQLSRDVTQTFLTTVRSARPEPKLADRQAEIIAHHQQVRERELVKPHRLADRPATEIHERLRFQKQDAPVVDLDLGLLASNLLAKVACEPPCARRSTSSKPILCRVPWYLLPGLPRPTTSLIVAKTTAPGSLPIPWSQPRPATRTTLRDHVRNDQSSFSFSLRSGLMTSGCVGDSPSAAVGLFLGPANNHVHQQHVGIGVDRHVRRQDQITDVNALIDLEIADVDLDRIGNRTGLALDAQAVHQMLENAAVRDAGRLTAQFDRDFGLDDFLGTHPAEIEVENLFAEVIPLHVADQNRLGRAADIEVGEMAGRS